MFEKRIGETLVVARAVVAVEPRPREAGDRSQPPVEVDLGTFAMLLPAELAREAEEILRTGCEGAGLYGYPVVDVRVRLERLELGDAPDPLLPLGASLSMALRAAVQEADTVVLEPVMRLEVRLPEDFLGPVMKDLGARRAEIRETAVVGQQAVIRGFVPLAEMFGYSTDLRSLTQGRGSFSLEPWDYVPVPEQIVRRDHLRLG